MNGKSISRIGLGCLAVLLLIGAAGTITLSSLRGKSIDLSAVLERRLSSTLDRRVSVGSARIVFGNPIHLDLTDFHIGNAQWGDAPDMVAIDRLSADLLAWPLLRGVMQYAALNVDGLKVVLERNDQGIGNWHFRENDKSSLLGRLLPWSVIPKNRTQFPTLRDFSLKNGAISYRTSSGNKLDIKLSALNIKTNSDDRPTVMDGDVSYNGTPGHIHVDGNSFASMRDASVPFGEQVLIATSAGSIVFDGNMKDPLNIDGVAGRLHIDSENVGSLLKIFGAGNDADLALHIDGAFTRGSDHWQLSGIAGMLDGNKFDGTLILDEGARHEADRVALSTNFATIDLKRLANADDTGKQPFSIAVDSNPSALFDVHLAAREGRYDKVAFSDLKLDGRLAPGEITVDPLSFAAAGGKFQGAAKAQAIDTGSRIEVRMDVSDAESEQVARWFGLSERQFDGRMNAHLAVNMIGTTVHEALGNTSGQAILSMMQGHVTRSLLEKVSTDLRALFRKNEESAPLTCLLAIADVRDGIATVAPLRLRTPDTTLNAGGAIDLKNDRVDMVLRSADKLKSSFALHLPLHIGGELSDVRVLPKIGGQDVPPDLPKDRFTPETLRLAEGNPCLQ